MENTRIKYFTNGWIIFHYDGGNWGNKKKSFQPVHAVNIYICEYQYLLLFWPSGGRTNYFPFVTILVAVPLWTFFTFLSITKLSHYIKYELTQLIFLVRVYNWWYGQITCPEKLEWICPFGISLSCTSTSRHLRLAKVDPDVTEGLPASMPVRMQSNKNFGFPWM